MEPEYRFTVFFLLATRVAVSACFRVQLAGRRLLEAGASQSRWSRLVDGFVLAPLLVYVVRPDGTISYSHVGLVDAEALAQAVAEAQAL